MRSAVIFGVAATVLLTGCATVQSSRVADGEWFEGSNRTSINYPPGHVSCEIEDTAGCFDAAEFRPSHEGITYFLPRRLVEVTVSRSNGTYDEAMDKLASAKLAVSLAEASVKSAAQAVKATEDQIVAAAGIANVTAILEARLTEQKAAKQKADAGLAEAKKEFESAKTELASLATADLDETADAVQKIALQIKLQEPTADPRSGYRLDPRHSILRDDEHDIVLTAGGLLSSTKVVASDRTADILVELATTAGAVSGLTIDGKSARSAPAGYARDSSGNCDPSNTPEELVEIIDFADWQSVDEANARLECMGVRFAPQLYGTPSGRSMPAAFDGIAYRTPIDLLVHIQRCEPVRRVGQGTKCGTPQEWPVAKVASFALPQAGPVSFITKDAGFATKSDYALTFQNGMLVQYDASRPSEALHLAATPMRIINGVFDGISKVISLRTGQNNALSGLTNSELALLQSRYALAAGDLEGATGLNEQQLALLESRLALRLFGSNAQSQISDAALQAEIAAITGQTQLSDLQLALLRSQAGLSQGSNQIAAQNSASQLALMLALLSDQARTDAVNRCIGEKVTSGEPIDSCLAR